MSPAFKACLIMVVEFDELGRFTKKEPAADLHHQQPPFTLLGNGLSLKRWPSVRPDLSVCSAIARQQRKKLA
jgi:hypothetical protein